MRLSLSGAEAVSKRFPAADEAQALKKSCETSQAVCTSLVKEKKTAAPPKLFDLTSLQREANRIYGYTAKQTLDLAQALYEKKLLTYPRTDSAYLTDDMGETAAGMVTLLGEKLPFLSGMNFFARNWKAPKQQKGIRPPRNHTHKGLSKTDLSALPESERNILTLAGTRLCMAAAAPHTFETVTAVFSCAGEEFTAKGKTVLSAGWKEIERRFCGDPQRKPEEEAGEPSALPELLRGRPLNTRRQR